MRMVAVPGAGQRRDVSPHALEDVDEAESGRAVIDVRDVDRAPGDDAPATTKKAEAEGSPGTVRSSGFRTDGRTVTTRPSPHGSTVMSAPASASISSVWVRVVTASRTTVAPSAARPASRMADFTCALATFDVQSMPRSAPPVTRSGGRQRSPCPSTVAPISSRGSATRSMGRVESDSSPTSSVSQAKPATRPASSRMEVPEFPQSSGCRWLVELGTAAVQDDGAVRRSARPARPSPRPRPARPRRRHRRRARGRPRSPRPGRRGARTGARSTSPPGVRTVPAARHAAVARPGHVVRS